MAPNQTRTFADLKEEIVRAHERLRQLMSQIEDTVRRSERDIFHSRELLAKADALLNGSEPDLVSRGHTETPLDVHFSGASILINELARTDRERSVTGTE